MAVILLFGLKKEKEKAVRTVAQKLGANVTEVVRKDYGQKLGALAGIKGFPKEKKQWAGLRNGNDGVFRYESAAGGRVSGRL